MIKKRSSEWLTIFTVIIAVSWLTGTTSYALDPQTATLDTKLVIRNDVKVPSKWNLEGTLQAHSVAGPASPWLGISGAYRVFEPLNLGVRGFVPLAHTVDDATYAIQGFVRLRVRHGLNTDLFLEAEGGENFYDFTPFTSYGLALGALTRVTPNLRVGITGGIEVANVVIDSIGLEDESGPVIYPKIGLIANFNL
jgi:hypothetical protein